MTIKFPILLLTLICFTISVSIAAGDDSAVDNLIANYVNNAYLASTLVNTAGQYVWDRKYDDADKLYHAVIEIHPNNPYATKAKVGLARLDVLNLIAEKKWSLAEQQMESMVADFNGEPDLAVSMFHIGKEFTWQHRYSEAKETFGLLLEQPLNNSFSQEAKLWIARVQVCSLIGQAKDEEVVASIDKLISDFENDAGLPEAIYWISKEYEWKKGTSEDRTGWFDKPNSVFQRLVQKFGYTSFGMDAEWDQKRITHRMNIFKLMKDGDQNAVNAEIEKMVADLSGRPEVVSELYWIACGYEERPDKSTLAEQMYQRIIKEYPGSEESNNAILDCRRLDIWDTFNSGDINASQVLLDRFIADFNQNSYSGVCLGRVAIKFLIRGVELKEQSNHENAARNFETSKGIWKRIIEELPQTSQGAPDALFSLGFCYNQMNQTDEAVKCYKKIAENWPDYKFADEAGLMAELGVKNVTIIRQREKK